METTIYKVDDALDFAVKFLYKLYEKNHRVMVLYQDEEFANELDRVLWIFKQSAFVPHVKEDSQLAEMTPIVLAKQNAANINKADVVLMFNQLDVPGEYSRVVKVFDDRALYEQAKQKDKSAICWVQKDEKWEKEANG
ncbi:MAG: DNA polymerase III subunit chi [Alphaproteobacteria bacterium]|nr:MAG: DNA polymerase III subunit chi [Alphaproteobacteria bacterium]